MKAIIEKVDNGYLVTDLSNKEQTVKHVVEEDEHSPEGDLGACLSLCWLLMDVLAVDNSKHRKKRLNLEIS